MILKMAPFRPLTSAASSLLSLQADQVHDLDVAVQVSLVASLQIGLCAMSRVHCMRHVSLLAAILNTLGITLKNRSNCKCWRHCSACLAKGVEDKSVPLLRCPPRSLLRKARALPYFPAKCMRCRRTHISGMHVKALRQAGQQ